MARVYYINYIDPETGFLKREEFTRHREQTNRIAELKAKGIKWLVEGAFEREQPA